jgi:hypothetical protein
MSGGFMRAHFSFVFLFSVLSFGLLQSCQPGDIKTTGPSAALTVKGTPPPINNAPIPPGISADCQNVTNGPITYSCQLDNASISCPNGQVTLPAVPDGQHTLTITSTDSLGDACPPATVLWFTDTTAPTVTLTQTPPSSTTSTTAQIAFVGNDAGSGIDHFECSLDSSAFGVCTSPVNLTGLALGAHSFEVVAKDKAGNYSLPAETQWTVTSAAPPPATANIVYLGVTSDTGLDQSIDQYLGKDGVARFYWTSSVSGLTYDLRVSQGSTVICEDQNVSADVIGTKLSHSMGATCSLLDGQSYQVQITGVSGSTSGGDQGSFLVDLTAPSIGLTQISPPPSGTSASIQLNVTDSGSGVSRVDCTLTLPNSTTQAIACSATGAVTFNNLANGQYTLSVTATDNAQNSSQNAITFQISSTTPVPNPPPTDCDHSKDKDDGKKNHHDDNDHERDHDKNHDRDEHHDQDSKDCDHEDRD